MGMISDQSILFALLGIVFGLLVWGRIRYDLVAFGALIAAVIIGVVPQEEAFAGFGEGVGGGRWVWPEAGRSGLDLAEE